MIQRKQKTRRKLFLGALLGATVLALLMTSMEHWLPYVHSTKH